MTTECYTLMQAKPSPYGLYGSHAQVGQFTCFFRHRFEKRQRRRDKLILNPNGFPSYQALEEAIERWFQGADELLRLPTTTRVDYNYDLPASNPSGWLARAARTLYSTTLRNIRCYGTWNALESFYIGSGDLQFRIYDKYKESKSLKAVRFEQQDRRKVKGLAFGQVGFVNDNKLFSKYVGRMRQDWDNLEWINDYVRFECETFGGLGWHC